jgi:hypothetical protein
MAGSTVQNGHWSEHQPATQRFCRTFDRFGFTYGLTVSKNEIDF